MQQPGGLKSGIDSFDAGLSVHEEAWLADSHEAGVMLWSEGQRTGLWQKEVCGGEFYLNVACMQC